MSIEQKKQAAHAAIDEVAALAAQASAEHLHQLGALKTRVGELMDLVDEGDRETKRLKDIIATFAHGSTDELCRSKFYEEGKPKRYLIDVVAEVLGLVPTHDAHGYLVLLKPNDDEGDTATKPVDVSHEGLPSPVLPTAPKPACSGCRAVEGRGHFAGCVEVANG